MKKAAVTFILLILLAGGAGYCIHRKHAVAQGDLTVAELLPEQTIAVVEITDVQRSLGRWQQTAIHKIGQEPQVAALLAQAETLIPANKVMERLAGFQKLEPKQIFVAATGPEREGTLKVIAGFDFTAARKDAATLVVDLQSDLDAQYPGWKPGSEQHGADKIETFTRDEDTVAVVFKGHWFFASNDLALLEETIDRTDGKANAKTSLRDNLTYQFCLSKLPRDPDAMAYIGVDEIVPVFEKLKNAAPVQDTEGAFTIDPGNIKGISAAMKFDGENMRDVIYVCYKPNGRPSLPLAFHSKAYTSPETVFYFVLKPNFEYAPDVYEALKWDLFGTGEIVNDLQSCIAASGLGVEDFKKAFGPEAGVVVNWKQDSQAPSLVFAFDIRDWAMAQTLTEMLVNKTPKQEIDGVKYYEWGPSWIWHSSQGHDTNPYVALTDKTLLFGLDLDSVRKAAESARANTGGIDKGVDFQAAGALVPSPTDSFVYIDTRTIFERSYNPFLKFLETQHSNPPLELPPVDVIGRHLSPIIFSQSTDSNGYLMESRGPVTLADVALFGAAADVALFLYGLSNVH